MVYSKFDYWSPTPTFAPALKMVAILLATIGLAFKFDNYYRVAVLENLPSFNLPAPSLIVFRSKTGLWLYS